MLDFPSGVESEINQQFREKIRRPGSECLARSCGQSDRPNEERQSPKLDRHYQSKKR
ncbi:hypothetical protein QUA40_27720 [Microcoleus sp. Pol11C3]|uniref:hypothetical protein n=1 Tax=Microcoleus sp. Pol11C3 TaxID=3055390 RepID=UPI002FD47ACD